MKKIYALCLGLLATTSGLQANYNGNIAEPCLIGKGFFLPHSNCFSVKLGYVRDYVSDRRLKVHDKSFTGPVDTFQMTSNLGMLTFSYAQRFEIYGAAGSTEIFFRNRPGVDLVPPIQEERSYQAKESAIYGVGGRAIFYQYCNTVFGANVSYYTSHPRLAWDDLHEGAIATKAKLTYNEWQISLGVAQKAGWLAPYLAVEFAGVKASLKDLKANSVPDTPDYKMRFRDCVGLVVGTSFVNGDYFDANIEFRTISQFAWSFALNAKF